MREMLDTLKSLQRDQAQLASSIDAINGRVNVLAGMKEVRDTVGDAKSTSVTSSKIEVVNDNGDSKQAIEALSASPPPIATLADIENAQGANIQVSKAVTGTSRIILT